MADKYSIYWSPAAGGVPVLQLFRDLRAFRLWYNEHCKDSRFTLILGDHADPLGEGKNADRKPLDSNF